MINDRYDELCGLLWLLFGFGHVLFRKLLTHFSSTDLFSAMFVDSKIAKNIVVGRSKLKYEINKGINPYLLEVGGQFSIHRLAVNLRRLFNLIL